MSSLLLIEIRVPHNAHREDDAVITAEWRKHQGFVVTQGRVSAGLFTPTGAARLCPSAEAAIRAATQLARGLAVAHAREPFADTKGAQTTIGDICGGALDDRNLG